MERVQIDLPHCTGVTDERGRHYPQENKRHEVTIPSHTAAALRASGAVTRPRKMFGGVDPLPTRADYLARKRAEGGCDDGGNR